MDKKVGQVFCPSEKGGPLGYSVTVTSFID